MISSEDVFDVLLQEIGGIAVSFRAITRSDGVDLETRIVRPPLPALS
jgi:hypothetical protein